MEKIMRTKLDILHDLWANIDVENVSDEDHFYTDGAAIGACMKILFYEDRMRYVGTIYMFPNGTWLNFSAPGKISKIIGMWIRTLNTPYISTLQGEAQE
jgi:hypothetical protein